MKLRLLIMCVIAACAGSLVFFGTASALDPFPRRTILGYTEWQNRQSQQSQQLRQLMLQRDIQRLREDLMSRNVDRQLDALKRRQAERDLLRDVRGSGTGTVDRVLMMPDSLRSSARKAESASKTAAANGNQAQPAVGTEKETSAKETSRNVQTSPRTDNGSRDEP
ncbi:MAG: hypothetical protein LDL33_15535 [Desulfomonile sp.]|nr:hypothetical protein [Desulfomonile sp.]